MRPLLIVVFLLIAAVVLAILSLATPERPAKVSKSSWDGSNTSSQISDTSRGLAGDDDTILTRLFPWSRNRPPAGGVSPDLPSPQTSQGETKGTQQLSETESGGVGSAEEVGPSRQQDDRQSRSTPAVTGEQTVSDTDGLGTAFLSPGVLAEQAVSGGPGVGPNQGQPGTNPNSTIITNTSNIAPLPAGEQAKMEIFSVMRNYSQESVGRLSEFLGSDDASVRTFAVEALKQIRTPASASSLRSAAEKAATVEERDYFLQAAEFVELPPYVPRSLRDSN